MASARILVVDDEPDIRELIGEILADEGFEAILAGDGAAAREARAEQAPDLILLDVWMPDTDGISLLREWKQSGSLDCPVVMISGHGSVEAAVEATRIGAFDFIEKPVSLAKLMMTIKNALESGVPRSGAVTGAERAPPIPDPIGRSPQVQTQRERMERLAAHDGTVLITGEPGVGKKTAARWIHARSGRADRPFVEVPCRTDAAAFEKLLAGDGDRPGLLEHARGGVLYFDDVSRLDPAGQRLLARTLEHQRTDPDRAGAAPLDARVIAATTAVLETLVQSRQFDESLFYQLAVLPMKIAALRERQADIPDLIRHFAEQLPGQQGVPYRHFPVAVQNRLRQHTWPGNLQQLKNVIQRLLVLGRDDEVSLNEVEAILGEIEMDIRPVNDQTPPLFDLPLREAREAFERQYLTFKLKTVDGSVGRLAEVVEMERTHLYRKLRQLGIDPKQAARQDDRGDE